jgi:hypothetical protein
VVASGVAKSGSFYYLALMEHENEYSYMARISEDGAEIDLLKKYISVTVL